MSAKTNNGKVVQLLQWMRDMVSKTGGYRKVNVLCEAELLEIIAHARDRFAEERLTFDPECFNLGVGAALISMKFFRQPEDRVAVLYNALYALVQAIETEYGGEVDATSPLMLQAKKALGRVV